MTNAIVAGFLKTKCPEFESLFLFYDLKDYLAGKWEVESA